MDESREGGRRHEEETPLGKPMDRRQFLKAAGLAGAAIGVGSAIGGIAGAAAEPADARRGATPDVSGDCVAILGLGAGPVYYPDRNNTGFALFHNGSAYLIDSGAGSSNKFMKLGVTLDKVKGVFFTHFHIDHTAGFADVLSRGSQANGPDHNLNPQRPLHLYGPAAPGVGGRNGLDVLTDGIKAGFGPGYELHFWARPYLGVPAQAPAPRPATPTHPITASDPDSISVIPVLTDDPDMRVDAIEVDHDEAFGTCYAYRFSLLNGGAPTGKTIVFSGDRAHYNARRDYSPTSPYYAEGGPGFGKPAYFPEHPTNAEFQQAFKAFAAGATVLVHEVAVSAWATRIADPNSPVPFLRALYWHLVDSHTDVSEVPVVARDAGVESLVLCHYGDYGPDGTTYKLNEGRGLILSRVLKANAKVGYRGKIIAPMELDVIHF
jgi:ribonuclease BN (tRNA processing enzyme)